MNNKIKVDDTHQKFLFSVYNETNKKEKDYTITVNSAKKIKLMDYLIDNQLYDMNMSEEEVISKILDNSTDNFKIHVYKILKIIIDVDEVLGAILYNEQKEGLVKDIIDLVFQ